jgi:hypothetical protein
MRALWTVEKRAAEALKRMAKPQGAYSKEWWTPERRAARSKRQRQGKVLASDLKEAYAAADRFWEKLRRGQL